MTPSPTGPPPGAPGEDDDPTRIFRFDLSGELAQPRGDIADRQNSAKAVRVGWFGGNFNKYFAMGGSFRFIATEPKTGPGGVGERTELFFDLIGIYLRVNIPVAPQLNGFIEVDPSMVGMHVPCDVGSFTCNSEGLEFVPRFGLIGRAGGAYAVVPDRLDLVAYASLEMIYPDEGGWLTFGAGITAHFGPTRGEIKRRQQWQQQQYQQQQYRQQPQYQPPPPQPSAPPPPPPQPATPPPPPPPPNPYRS